MKRFLPPYLFLLGIILLFVSAVSAHDLAYYYNYCYHTYDLGIYMEAVRDFSFSHPNPFLHTFGYGFLNNHWNPALALAKLPTILFGLPYGVFLTEIMAHVFTALIPVWLVYKGYLKLWTAVLVSTFLLINENILESTLAIPIHCEVWANFPLLFVFAFLLVKAEKFEEIITWPIYVFVFVISFFSEQFSLSGLGLSLVYFILSKKKIRAVFPLIFSIFMVWFTMSGRELLIGPILHHTGRVSFNPVTVFHMYGWDFAQFKVVGKFLLSPLIFIFVVYKSKEFPLKNNRLLFYRLSIAIGIFGPLLLGRLLSNSFGHQYSALLPIITASLAVIFLEEVTVSPRIFGLCVSLFFILAFSKFERIFNVLTERSLPNCVYAEDVKSVNQQRLRNLNEEFLNFGKITADEALRFEIFAGGNLVPNLVAQFPQIRTVTLDITRSPGDLSEFGWIITEYGSCGDSWPWSREVINHFVAEISQRKDFKVLKKTGCLFAAQRLF